MKTFLQILSSMGKMFITKLSLHVLFILFSSSVAFGQDPELAWLNVWSIGKCYDVATDASGFVYTAGTKRSAVTEPYLIDISKFTSEGRVEWDPTYYTPPAGASAVPVGMVLDREGNIYVLANLYTTSVEYVGADHAVLLKFDNRGILVWDEFYDVTDYRDDAEALAIDRNTGEVIITGTSTSLSGTSQFFTVKYDPMGLVRWDATGAGSSSALVVDLFGNTIVAATTPNPTTAASKDWTTIKYNSAGEEVWRSPFNHGILAGTPATAGKATDIVLDEAGDVYVAGKDELFVAIVKCRGTDGDIQWSNHEPVTAEETNTRFPKAGVFHPNNVYLAFSDAGAARQNLVRYDNSGLPYWRRQYDHALDNLFVKDMVLDRLGNVYVASVSEPVGHIVSTITKYDSEGNLEWVIGNPDPGFGWNPENIKALLVDGDNIYLAGSYLEGADLHYELLHKYVQPPPSDSIGVLPPAFDSFGEFNFAAYARDWCWTGIFVDWKVVPLCIPPLCEPAQFSTSLRANGKVTWNKQFDKPFNVSLPVLNEPQVFALAQKVNNTFQDVIVLDDNLVKSGIGNLFLSAFPHDQLLKMKVETINGKDVPFSITFFNKEGKSLLQKEFMAPISEDISAKLNEPVAFLKISAATAGLKMVYYPNPVSGVLTVSIDKGSKLPAQLTLISMQGEKLLQQTIQTDGNTSLDLKAVKPGLYILSLKAPEGEVKELIAVK